MNFFATIMIYIILLACILAPATCRLTNVVNEVEWKRPWFCHDCECRPYTVVNKTDNFEKRCYPAALWLMTYRSNIPVGEPSDFAPLYKVIRVYIDGYNVDKMKFNLTVPVLLRIDINSSYITLHSHVWVPPYRVPLLPKPSDSKLHFVETEHYCVFVRSFGGRVHSYNDRLKMETEVLEKDLDRAGHFYKTNFVWFASYDAPWRVNGRHNEIWLREKHNKPLND